MKIELLLSLSIVLALGCSRSNQKAGDEDDAAGAGGGAAQGGECEDAADGSWCGLDGDGDGDVPAGHGDDVDVDLPVTMGSVQQVVSDSACGTLGERRDATASEEAEYCVCQHVYADEPAIWVCYGPDPANPPDILAPTCDGFIASPAVGAAGGTGGTGGTGSCEITWTCDDGNYSILCLEGTCNCQIDGVQRDNLPLVEETIQTCTTDLDTVNKVCFWDLQ